MASQNHRLSPTPFTVSIPKEALSALYKLVELSPIPGSFYEGQHAKFGVTSSWMTAAKSHWLTKFDW
jgi:microsomal epoxide hydrolase